MLAMPRPLRARARRSKRTNVYSSRNTALDTLCCFRWPMPSPQWSARVPALCTWPSGRWRDSSVCRCIARCLPHSDGSAGSTACPHPSGCTRSRIRTRRADRRSGGSDASDAAVGVSCGAQVSRDVSYHLRRAPLGLTQAPRIAKPGQFMVRLHEGVRCGAELSAEYPGTSDLLIGGVGLLLGAVILHLLDLALAQVAAGNHRDTGELVVDALHRVAGLAHRRVETVVIAEPLVRHRGRRARVCRLSE